MQALEGSGWQHDTVVSQCEIVMNDLSLRPLVLQRRKTERPSRFSCNHEHEREDDNMTPVTPAAGS